jgi:hypothetical protein
LPHELTFVRNHDIVLLQETFAREDADLLELPGFYSHHTRALPRQGSRNIWGLSSYFRTETFADGFWIKTFSPVDWLLISRWKRDQGSGIMVLNIYIPAHTRGFTAPEIAILRQTLEDLLSTHPGDIFLIAGDFNFDRYDSNILPAGMAK